MNGGLTATGLLLLLLAFIGAGVGLYYAYICLQARPLRSKKHKDAERGPLIPPDFNGNHEDVANDPSAPLHDVTKDDLKLHPDLDTPDSAPSPPSPDPPRDKDKKDVLISVEEDVPPAKVMHEKETAPAVHPPAPIGFVVPPPPASPQEAPLDHHPVPRNLQPQPEKTESPPSTSSAPVPLYIPSPPQKRTNPISDEEDGLLLQDPAPGDHSLNPHLCNTLPASHPPPKPSRVQDPATAPQSHPAVSPPRPEAVAPVIPPRQPIAVPRVEITPEPEAEPVVAVLPHTPPSGPGKEELKPVGKAADTCDKPALVCMEDDEHLPSEAASKDLHKEAPIHTPTEAPVMKAVSPEPLSAEPRDTENIETAVDSDDSLSTGDPSDTTELTPKAAEKIEAPEISPENHMPEPTPVNTDVHEEKEEEPRPISSCSESSEDSLPPYHSLVSVEATSPAEGEAITPLASGHPQPKEDVKEDIPATPATMTQPSDIPPPNTAVESLSAPPNTAEESLSSPDLPPNTTEESLNSPDTPPPSSTEESLSVPPNTTEESLSAADPPPNTTEESLSAPNPPANTPEESLSSPNIPQPNITEESLSAPEGKATPRAPPHLPTEDLDGLSDASSDVSNANEDLDTPTQLPPTPLKPEVEPGKETAVPSPAPSPPVDFPIDASSLPMEAYTVMLDDLSDEEGSPLPVITEEGSLENNSEGTTTDTDSSEPEVTEYSFSSGPSALSTTGVLADEVSYTLEPKVTKFSLITNPDVSESGVVVSDDDDDDDDDDESEEEDSAFPSKDSDDEAHDNADSGVKNKVMAEDKSSGIDESSNDESSISDPSEQHSVPNIKPATASNGPTASETTDPEMNTSDSDSSDTDTESEGAEAEVGAKEKVGVPATVCENTTNNTTKPPATNHTGSPIATKPLATNHTGSPLAPCPPKPKAPQAKNNSLEEISSATDDDDDGLSLSPSESCDLSDGELATSTPKKSMIPRLLKQSEAGK